MFNIIEGCEQSAWRGLIYGVPGIGKSTIATSAPNPLFLNCEDGIKRIKCAKTELIKKYTNRDETKEDKSELTLVNALRFFAGHKDFKTAVIDTVDAVEVMISRHVCQKYNWKTIEQPGYGKGHMIVQEVWSELLDICDTLVSLNKNVLFIGHDTVKNFAAPDTDAYDRYRLKLNQKVADLIFGKMDFVFFAQYERTLKEDKTLEDRVRAVGTGRRIFRTQECPAWMAKNRFGLEATIPMNGDVFSKLV